MAAIASMVETSPAINLVTAADAHERENRLLLERRKDSALALHRIRWDERYEVVSLLTTCHEHFQRVSMRGVRLELLDR